jgi:protein involved in polysaccharide export with SLBB domain
MTPLPTAIRRAGGLLLALFLGGAAPAFAEFPDSIATRDLLGEQTPGRESVESLRRVLSVPSAGTRWNGLPVFGRDLFHGIEPRFSPVEDGPVGPDYVLGPGDNLIVFVSSLVDSSYALMVDREGKVFLPQVGSTFLWGLSFADAERLIKERLGTVLRNARIQVSMGRVRTVEVFVLGAVLRPGKVTLSGFATAFNALYAAGGPEPLGSLRNIRVLRANREIARLDLYPFLLQGDRSNDSRLQSGDVVFVDFVQTQVGIVGAVQRPGVYESQGPMSLRTLLAVAGGATSFADLERIRVERVDPNGGGFRLQDLPLDHGHGIDPDSLMLSNYDLVTVMPLNERVRNAVTLDGYVRHPGEYELAPGMRLSQLVVAERLLPEAALDRAELRRVDPTSFQVEVRAFSVRRAWSGEDDLELRPLDAVTVFSSARFPQTVVMEGQVLRPGTYTLTPGERLSDLLKRAGGTTPHGHLPAAMFLRPSVATRERSFLREFVERQRLELAQQQARLAQSGDSVAAGQVIAAQLALTQALERQTDPGRVVLDLDENGKWIGTTRDPVLENGDRLIVPVRPATVTVIGSVMNPGTLMAHRRGSIKDYIAMAGGLTRQADFGHSYVLRANGEALPRSAASRIEPGDAIVVPPKEAGTGGLGRVVSSTNRFLMELATVGALILAVTK